MCFLPLPVPSESRCVVVFALVVVSLLMSFSLHMAFVPCVCLSCTQSRFLHKPALSECVCLRATGGDSGAVLGKIYGIFSMASPWGSAVPAKLRRLDSTCQLWGSWPPAGPLGPTGESPNCTHPPPPTPWLPLAEPALCFYLNNLTAVAKETVLRGSD